MSDESTMTAEEKVDEVKRLVHQITDVVQNEVKDSAETKQKLEKIGEEITNIQGKISEFTLIQSKMLERVSEEDEEKVKIFDLALNRKELTYQWGYDANPINKAMYRPRTKLTNNGYKLVGSYEGLEDAMMMNDACFIIGLTQAQADGNLLNYPKYVRELDTYKMLNAELKGSKEFSKALNTSDGSDWVPTAMSAQMIDDYRMQLKVAAQFPQVQLPARTGTFNVPNMGSRRRAYLIPEATADSSDKIPTGTPPTGKTSFDAVKHALRMLLSYEMEEDAIVPMIPIMRSEISQALADAEEDGIINGDNSSTHMDTGYSMSGTDVRKSWKGLRYYSNATNGNARVDISTLSTANLRAMKKAMGRFGGQNPSDLFWLTSITGWIQMMGNTDVLTFDKYGSMFTLNNGELSRFDGSPVIVSEFVSQELNTAGLYDGSTVTDTVILLVSKRAFWRAYKGQMLAEQERDIEVQQHKVVMSHRLDFERVWTPGSGEDVVAAGYSLTS